MEKRIIYFTHIFIFCQIVLVSCQYKKFDIEEKCTIGKTSVLYENVGSNSVGILKAKTQPSWKSRNCTFVLKPPPGFGVVVSIRELDLQPKKNSLCRDYLKIFHSDVFESPTTICRYIFDVKEFTSYFSEGPMTITYFTQARRGYLESELESRFRITYTTVSQDVNDCKGDDNFFCGNGRCISKAYTCDTRNNCGDRSDESPLICENNSYYGIFRITDSIYISMITIALFIVITMCLGICLHRRRRRAHNQVLDDYPVSDQDVPSAKLTPYQAVHPSGFGICQNPAGPSTLYPNPKLVQVDGGFSNPCYPSGMPQSPPPYAQ